MSLGYVACEKKPTAPVEQTEPPKASGEIVTATYALAQVRASLRIIGRSAVIGTGISCDLTASGIEFSAYMEGTVTLRLSCNKNVYFAVYVDDVQTKDRVLLTPSDTTLRLAEFLEGGEHTVRVLKQNESMHSLCVLESLHMTGYWLDAPKQAERYVEFIGDSITCGYGVLGDSSTENAGSYQYADGLRTYAFLTARRLGTDYSMVSCTGIGVVNGYRDFVMADFYAQTSYYRSREAAFTPIRVPDLIVINLGTNDNSTGVSDGDFTEKAKQLIAQARALCGERVPIVWCYGMMNHTKRDALRQAINDLEGENGGLYLCELPRDGAGGGGHPSAAGQRAAADALTQYIQDKNLLK